MSLTTEQQRFINRYINSKGNFYQTIDSLGLELAHVLSWQETNLYFSKAYSEAKQQILCFLREENYITAVRELNEVLKNGVSVHSVTQKHKSSEKDGDSFEVTKSTKNLGVPMSAISEALKESSIVKAVNTLANEGVIPTTIAKRILQAASKISVDITTAFDVEKETEYVDESKAIALIKAAVLGEVDV
jgi:DNA-binding transcriptional ArsR family regulator